MELVLRARLLVSVPVALWRVCARRASRAAPARILMFHGTPRRLAAELERQLRYLARRFDVVPLRELDGKPGQVALTFDDGLRSNVEVAYPILRRLGLPATFFVCPGLIDARRWLWNHEARARLRRLGEDAGAIEALVARMKTLPVGERRAIERQIEERTPGFQPSAQEREACDLAGWDELRSLHPDVVTIGSHTLTHPILGSLPAEEARAEICGSRALLEERLARPVELFCYPNGDVDATSLELARSAYRVAVTVGPGDVRPGSDPLLLPRHAAPRGLLRLAWLLSP